MAAERRRRGCLSRIFFGIVKLAVFVIIVLLAIYWLPPSFDFSGGDSEYAANASLPGGWTNILLLGSDERKGEARGRTDTIIIASINDRTGDIKLTSLMRDTMVDIPGHGSDKINAAYRFGGAELAVSTVNQAFGTNITKYAVVDFESFPYIIDSLDGIVLSVTEAERVETNNIIRSMRHMYEDTEVDTSDLAISGERIKLTGLQALAFSRIRKTDDDYARTSRQRNVINAILSKVKSTRNPATLVSFASATLERIDTNLGVYELIAIGSKVLIFGDGIKEYRLPADGTYESGTYGGVWSIRPNLDTNRAIFYENVYGS